MDVSTDGLSRLAVGGASPSRIRGDQNSAFTGPAARLRPYGRVASAGLRLNLSEMARQAISLALPCREFGMAVRPASITSASPSATSRDASPIACAPLEHAVTTAWFGPRSPCAI